MKVTTRYGTTRTHRGASRQVDQAPWIHLVDRDGHWMASYLRDEVKDIQPTAAKRNDSEFDSFFDRLFGAGR